MVICYIVILISVTICSVGWFLASASNELVSQMPSSAILIHNTFGVFSYMTFPYLPIVAGSELVSTFLINCLARYFEAWSSCLVKICSGEAG